MSVVAIFASGAGSNAQNIINYFKPSKNVEIGLILSNNKNAGVLGIGRNNKIETLIVGKSDFANPENMILKLKSLGVEWIILAGFLWKVPEAIIDEFPNKIINIHPALLPKYGGKGMYGRNVHSAVKEADEKESGITIHYVNRNYDEGAIISQHKCSIRSNDSIDEIERKVRALEIEHFPKEIEKLIDN